MTTVTGAAFQPILGKNGTVGSIIDIETLIECLRRYAG
jgi:hypothetical protein